MSIGQNLSPMTRYALVLGSRSCPTLSAAAVCPSLDTCTAPTPTRPITVLYKRALWVLLMIGDEGLAVPDNTGYEQWRLTCEQ